jgi:hypothetical protein
MIKKGMNKEYRMKIINTLVAMIALLLITGNLKADDVKLSYALVGKIDLEKAPIETGDIPPGVTTEKNKITLKYPANKWKGHWNAGQFKLPENGKIILKAKINNGQANFSLQLYGGQLLPSPDTLETKDGRITAQWNITPGKSRFLAALWLTLQRKEADPSQIEIEELSVWRKRSPNAINAD